jgi:hypothetical protein
MTSLFRNQTTKKSKDMLSQNRQHRITMSCQIHSLIEQHGIENVFDCIRLLLAEQKNLKPNSDNDSLEKMFKPLEDLIEFGGNISQWK